MVTKDIYFGICICAKLADCYELKSGASSTDPKASL